MDPLSQRLMMGAAGGGPPVYIEDVFSTWLYTGNGGTQTITNGIDLAGKGGLVWTKKRSATDNHVLQDTVNGKTSALATNLTDAIDAGVGAGIQSFNSDGYTQAGWDDINGSGFTFVSWTFRRQPKFFDVVTYTGTGASSQIVSHSLGVAPACIIIKKTSAAQNWRVYTRKSDTVWSSLYLNLTNAGSDFNYSSISPALTSTTIDFGYISTNIEAFNNDNGATYVAYLFAHNAGGFGPTGTDNVISCGSYTGTGVSPGPRIELGFEPQFILYKRVSGGTGDWGIHDSMRWLGVGSSQTSGSGNRLEPNTSDPETGASNFANIDATGFTITPTVADINGSGSTYIYIAIRRGPMRTPTSGTSVFAPVLAGDTESQGVVKTTGFPVDMQIPKFRAGGSGYLVDRLRGVSTTNTDSAVSVFVNTTDAESTSFSMTRFWNNTGYQISSAIGNSLAVYWNFRRAPGFFDVVCYSGAAFIPLTVNHNLSVAPELIIIKKRSSLDNWMVYTSLVPGKSTLLNSDSGTGTDSSYPTSISSTSITLPYSGSINVNGSTFVAYLFASCPGVSKVGTYTGTGSTLQVNCGFTTGARFVLIRRVDGNISNWYVWDTARGIIAANDPYVTMNSTATEVTNTDWIDPISSGFEVSNAGSNLVNANGGTYLFLAIA